MKKPSSSPAQRGRSRIADAVRRRGQSPYNLWVIRPPFDTQDVILNSDPKMELFYFLEGDPQLDEIDYGPLRQVPTADALSARHSPPAGPEHFANIVRSGTRGRVLWGSAHLRRPDSLAPTDSYVTLSDLDDHRLRVDNWRRIVPAIRRTRPHPTIAVERQILCLLGDDASKTVSAILEASPTNAPALIVGVIGLLLRQRKIDADLDRRPWSLHTKVHVRRSS